MPHTIALVDDDQNILTSLSAALEDEGYSVDTYVDGVEALDGIARRPVDLAILDAEGNLVHWFDAFRRMGPRRVPGGGQKRESLGDYTIRGLKQAIPALDLAHAPTAEHPLKLPDLEQPGIRIFVRLLEERMIAYRAPVVEVVALNKKDWEPLKYPRKERRVEAAALKKWLSQVYPPGVMERTSQQTKKVYQIDRIEGDLTIKPAGSDGKLRYALPTPVQRPPESHRRRSPRID